MCSHTDERSDGVVPREREDRGLRADRRHPDRRAGEHGRARSTGCACPGSTRAPASPRCSGDDDDGRWLLAPSGAITRQSPALPRPARWCWRPSSRPPTARCAIVDCMPIRDRTPDVVRVVAGRRGAGCRCTWSCPALRLRLHRAVGAPGRRPSAGARPDPTRWSWSRPVETRGEDFRTLADFTVAAGDDGAVRACAGTRPTSRRRRRSTRSARSTTPRRGGRSGPRRAARLDNDRWRDEVQRSLITLKALTYAPTGGIVAAPRRRCPRRSAVCATGTTATAGCATPRSRSTR